jgi:hypothetical protein
MPNRVSGLSLPDRLAARRFPHRPEQSFDRGDDVLARDERHLDVNLRELGLSVRPQVFVAETFRELKIALHAGDHQHLFELLRRLRQREHLAGVDPAGHEILARAFGRALEQDRRLDLVEPFAVKIIAHGFGDPVPGAELGGHLGPAQVEVAVRQPQFLAGVNAVLDRERRRLARVEDFEVVRDYLDLAGREFGVGRALGPAANQSLDTNDKLGPQRMRRLGGVPVVFGVEDDLRHALAVADVDEHNTPKVAPGVNPAAERDLLPDVFFAQFRAVMGPFHDCTLFVAAFVVERFSAVVTSSPR